MQHAEMRMTASPIVCNYTRGFRIAARIFGFRILKSMRKHDLGAMLLARNRISYWFGVDVDNSGDREAASPLLLVKLELYWFEHWLVKGLNHCGNDAEHRRKWFGLLPAQDFQQGFSLLLIGSLIDDPQGLAMPLVDGTRPGTHGCGLEAVQPDVAEMALIDS